jgi:hypothetical protein
MLDLVDRSIGEARHHHTNFPRSRGTSGGDSSELENAILNLCVNARDAMNGWAS